FEDICDHSRVSELLTVDYSEGVCQPLAYKCDNYSSFSKGFCSSCENNGCRPFGLSIQTNVNKTILTSEVADKGYYLKTSGESPYCEHHYQIVGECNTGVNCEGIMIYIMGKTSNSSHEWFSAKLTKMNDNIYTGLLTINSKKFADPFKATFAFSTINISRQFKQIEVKYMSNANIEVR
ncbi:lipoxygenase-like protein, partial [Leptotrombidium deliense]